MTVKRKNQSQEEQDQQHLLEVNSVRSNCKVKLVFSIFATYVHFS